MLRFIRIVSSLEIPQASSSHCITPPVAHQGQALLQAQLTSRSDAYEVVDDSEVKQSGEGYSVGDVQEAEQEQIAASGNNDPAGASQAAVKMTKETEELKHDLNSLKKALAVDAEEAQEIAEGEEMNDSEAEEDEMKSDDNSEDGADVGDAVLLEEGADDDIDDADDMDADEDFEDDIEDDDDLYGDDVGDADDDDEDLDDAFLAVTVVSRTKQEILSCIQDCAEDSKFGLCASDCVFDFPSASNSTALLEQTDEEGQDDSGDDVKPRKFRRRRRRRRRSRRRKINKRAKRKAKRMLRKAKRSIKVARKIGKRNMKRLWKLKGTMKKCYSSAAVSCAATTSCYPYLRQHAKHLKWVSRKIGKISR